MFVCVGVVSLPAGNIVPAKPNKQAAADSYIVDTCLLPEYIIVGLFSGLFFPFFCLFGTLDFWIFRCTCIYSSLWTIFLAL